jgi:hypothetical protein
MWYGHPPHHGNPYNGYTIRLQWVDDHPKKKVPSSLTLRKWMGGWMDWWMDLDPSRILMMNSQKCHKMDFIPIMNPHYKST